MSGFVATSGKYEVFAPGSDTYVMFNDSNDVNAVSGLTFTKGTGTLQSTIFKIGDGTAVAAAGSINVGTGNDLGIYHNGSHSFLENNTGDLTILTDGSGAGIILDAEDDTIEIKYSGAAGANFGTSGLNIVAGDSYSIGGTAVVSATGAALVQPAAITGRTELGSGAVVGASDMLVIADASDSFALKKVTPDNLGITGGSGGEDVLQRALRNVGLVEVDAS